MTVGPYGFEQGAAPSTPTTVPAMVARHCAERPDAPAIQTADQVLTYAELDARASALAARLRPHLRGEEPVVALLLDRGPDFVIAMLAAWRTGCAFSPIDPASPAARIGYLLDDLDACAVVTDSPDRVPTGTAVSIVDVTAADGPAAPAGHLPAPDATAYVLYTSGTTGAPKGVPIRHRGLAQVVTWVVDQFGLGPGDRASQLANVGFDAAQLETWPCLAAGGCLLPHRQPVVVPELADWLAAGGVTHSFLATPLAEALWTLPAPLPRLRSLLIGAAALTRRAPPLPYPVWNLYGPTECTILATAHQLSDVDGPVNVVGRPIPGTRVYVLDENGDRVPVGQPGEIHIGGVGVAPGYWRRPALSRQRFAATDPDGGPGPVYRTGDRGRWLPDGTLEFLGRLDRQIELRGYRIEPGEVETRLRADPLVGAALVRAAGPRLAAYLVPHKDADKDADRDTAAVLARLAGLLPAHLVPEVVVWLDELPLTERGKVDEARLPRPDRVATAAAYVPPSGDLERRVAAVWARVLGVDTVGVHDNFFDLGGSSLLLLNLRAELQAELGVPLPIQRLFEHTTVHALAKSLAAQSPPDDLGARDRAARARQARAARRR
uniref:Non-ribosomal peptide synthetase n=1 Tax=uncultured bacterium AZ_40 TaxID=1630016 RepID=A0A0E3M1S0_9BACT|nr:non-ribosomal peptide synthetase [uncultured bacterium AZ_40]